MHNLGKNACKIGQCHSHQGRARHGVLCLPKAMRSQATVKTVLVVVVCMYIHMHKHATCFDSLPFHDTFTTTITHSGMAAATTYRPYTSIFEMSESTHLLCFSHYTPPTCSYSGTSRLRTSLGPRKCTYIHCNEEVSLLHRLNGNVMYVLHWDFESKLLLECALIHSPSGSTILMMPSSSSATLNAVSIFSRGCWPRQSS